MTARVPLWVRGLLGADRALHGLASAERAALALLLGTALDARAREEVTQWLYGEQGTYLPGGAMFDEGLAEWEQLALATPPFPRSGTVLLGAAGGGRELAALAARGYRVVAFEPSPALYEGLSRTAARFPGARVARGSYADLVRAARGDGPLAELVRGERFDAVLLGWLSLSHVLDARARAELLAALRALAPRAPVLASFYTAVAEGGFAGRLARAADAAARLLRRPPRERELFLPWAGFSHLFTRDEIQRLAERAGYEISRWDTSAYPWVLLTPRAA